MPIQKIKSGRITTVDLDNYIGNEGQLFYDEDTGELRLSDGLTPGGVSILSGGSGSYILPTASTSTKGGVKIDGSTIVIENQIIKVGSISYSKISNPPQIPVDISDLTDTGNLLSGVSGPQGTQGFQGVQGATGIQGAQGFQGVQGTQGDPAFIEVSLISSDITVTNTVTNVSALRFDSDSGFDIVDLGSGAVKIGMNSTFKTWQVDGQEDLVAQGLDTVKFIAGSGIVLKTNSLSNPKTLEISSIDKILTLYQDGILTITTGTVRWYAPYSLEIIKITSRLVESADDIITVDINKNNSTELSVNINTGSIKTITTTSISMITDDYLTVDISKIGTTNTGVGLSIEFSYRL